MNKQTVIYVVRHGQAELNVKCTIGGTFEPNPLTSKGKEQAINLAKTLENVAISKIFSSDLSRAKETAEIIGLKKQVPVEINKLLRERSWGSLQGKTFEEAKAENPVAFLKETRIEGEEALRFKYVEDMESLEDAFARFKQFLKEIIDTYRDKTVLVVSHFDIIVGYLVYLGFGSYQKLMNASLDHTGYYTLIASGEDIKIVKVIGLNINNE